MNINISGEVVRTSQLPKRIIGLGDYLVALNSSPLETSTVLVSDFVSFLNTQFATSLASLTDVSINGPLSGQALVFNGSYWVNQNLVSSLAGLSDVTIASLNPDQLLRYDGTSWKNWTPTFYSLPVGGTTLQYIDGTGALQTFPTTLPTNTVKHQVKAGVPITKGQAVYVTSADGTNMIVGLASNASESTSSKTMGLLDATVTTNGFANVVTEGLLAGLDTTGANAAGDPVWLGTGGNLIYGLVNKPYAPNHLVFIGIVTRRNANNGEIFVKPQNGFELDELHNVDARNPNNNDGIFYNSTTQLWEHKQISSVFPTPTLAQVTTAGNTTTNNITVGTLYFGNASHYLVTDNSTYAMLSSNRTLQLSTSGNPVLSVFTTQNVAIGTTTDAGYKLDVNGTGRFSSSITGTVLKIDGTGAATGFEINSQLDNDLRPSYMVFSRGGTAKYIIGHSYGRSGFFISNGNDTVTYLNINSTGNVLVGTTTDSNAKFVVAGSITAASAIARGVYFNNTLVAAANNDVLVGLDINPTFTNGASTGVSNIGLRVKGDDVNGGSGYSLYAYGGQAFIKGNWSIDNGYNLIVQNRAGLDSLRVRGDGLTILEKLDVSDGANKGFTVSYSGVGGYQFGLAVTDAGVAFTNGAAASRPVSFSMNTGEILRIHQNYTSIVTNNFLIGTTTDAGYKLDVNGTGIFRGNLEVNAGANGGLFINNLYPRILFGKTGTPTWSMYADTENSGQFELGTGAGFPYNTFSSRLHITNSGNVGIGIAPIYKLDVNGTARIQGNTEISRSGSDTQLTIARGGGASLTLQAKANTTSSSEGVNLYWTANTWLKFVLGSSVVANFSNVGNLLVGTSTDAGFKLDVVGAGRVGDSSNYGTVFAVRAPGSGWEFDYLYLTSGTVVKLGGDRLQLRNNSGTVYIGNNGDSDLSSLTLMGGVNGGGTLFAPIIFGSGRNASLSRETMRIDNQNQFVGIGTTTPSTKLHVSGAVGDGIILNGISSVGMLVQAGNLAGGSGTVQLFAGNNNNSYLRLASEYIREGAGGGLGVNVSRENITAKFQVRGSGATSATTSFLVQNSSNNNQYQITDNGTHYFSSNGNIRLTIANASSTFNQGVVFLNQVDFSQTNRFQIDYDSVNDIGRFRANNGGMANGMTMTSLGPIRVGIGQGINQANASSVLELQSTTLGFLAPRMTTAQILAITTPAEGLQVYNTDLHTICFFDGTIWQRVTSTAM